MPHPLTQRLNSIFAVADAARARHAAQARVALEQARAMRLAKAKAADHGIDIDKDRAGGWWVTCTKFDDDNDPCDGNHFCSTAEETLEAVEVYVAALTVTP